MRVLNVMLSEGLGGLESAFLNYAAALTSQGAECVCCITRGAKIARLIDLALTTIEMRPGAEWNPRAVLEAHRLIARIRPDVILVHGRRALKLFSTAQRLFRHRTPLVAVLHGPRFKYLARAQHVITVSRALRDDAITRGIPPERITAIPNFMTGTAPVVAEYAPHTPPVVGILGRFNAVKGFDIFIDAIARLKQQGLEFKVLIGGNGEEHDALKARVLANGVTDRIEWLGWVEDTDSFYTRIDVFCLPSRRESFGLALLEAMARGKAIVATRTSGPLELITHGHNGMLCDIDAESMAQQLQYMLAHPAAAGALATNARNDSAAYRIDAVAPRIFACLTSVAAFNRYG